MSTLYSVRNIEPYTRSTIYISAIYIYISSKKVTFINQPEKSFMNGLNLNLYIKIVNTPGRNEVFAFFSLPKIDVLLTS